MSVAQILPNGGRSPNPQPRLVEARVSSLQPAPSSFTDPLFVVENHDPNHAIRITNWPALHGKTLPAANALVLVSFVGDQRTPRVIYWSGTTLGSSWATPTLASGWTAAGGAEATPAYMKDQLGFVHVRGAIKKSSAWSVFENVFTLPAGFRPAAVNHYMGWLWDSSNGFASVILQVAPDGTIELDSAPRFTTNGTANIVTLSAINFLAEN